MDLNSFKLISFDIFDTLLSRRIYRPKDLFSLIQSYIIHDDSFIKYPEVLDNFTEWRIQAESNSRVVKVKKTGGEPEVTISDIYAEFKLFSHQIDDDLISKLIALEIKVEKLVLYKCPEGEKLFKNAVESGANVIVISDMYFPSNVLKELLSTCGYDINGVRIYSSGEEQLSKHSGKIYTRIIDELDIQPSEWLHIGDNLHADINNAKKHKIQTLHAQWSEYSHERSYHWTAKDVVGESIYRSLDLKQASQFYKNDEFVELGFKVFGPLLLGFISWLSMQLKNQGIQKALFLARDAHLIERIYNKYFNYTSIDSEYIYLSRASTYKMGMTDWPMHRIWHLFGGKNKKSISKIFSMLGLDAKLYMADLHHVGFPDENHVPQIGEEQKVHWLINKLFIQVMNKNTQLRHNYAQYFVDACRDYEKVALIDVGWMGNIQSVFARSLGEHWASKDIYGFYLATFEGALDNKSYYNSMSGWLSDYGSPLDKQNHLLSGGVELMEFALADNTGSTIGYIKTDEGILPLRDESSDSEKDYLDKAGRLQDGIMSFFDYVSPLLKINVNNAFSSVVLAEPFFRLINEPSSTQLNILASLTHSESAGANSERLVLADRISLRERLFPGKVYQESLEKSYWKEAFKRLNRKRFWKRY